MEAREFVSQDSCSRLWKRNSGRRRKWWSGGRRGGAATGENMTPPSRRNSNLTSPCFHCCTTTGPLLVSTRGNAERLFNHNISFHIFSLDLCKVSVRSQTKFQALVSTLGFAYNLNFLADCNKAASQNIFQKNYDIINL